MARGGRRRGAGRPAGTTKLSLMQKMRVGALCERILRKKDDAAVESLLAEKSDSIREIWAEANRIPIEKRSGWLESEDYKEHQEELKTALFAREWGAGTVDELAESLDGLGGGPDELPEPDRVRSIDPPRQYRQRGDIVARVAERTGLTPQQVDTAWKQFRKTVRSLDEEE